MSSACITSPLGNISLKNTSHRGAWAYLWANQLLNCKNSKVDVSNDINGYDLVYLYHGMEFKDKLNLFGGVNDKTIDKIESLLESKATIISLDINTPMYGNYLEHRIGNKSSSSRLTKSLCNEFNKACKTFSSFFQSDLKTDYLCLGDSHSFSAYKPNAMCDRHDGLTLYGMLKRGIKSYISPFKNINKLTIYMGNIDIRHHLCRDNSLDRTKELMAEYEKQLMELGISDIELVTPLPVEDESRKLPRSGYYKGTPFYGSREDRLKCLYYFIDKLKDIANKYNFSIFSWPQYWYSNDGKEFFEYMEKPQSVHLSREYYRWNLEKNIPNNLLTQSNELFSY